MAMVPLDGCSLHVSRDHLRNDMRIVLAAITENGNALEFASESMRDNREVVLVAVCSSGEVLNCLSQRLQNDREVVLAEEEFQEATNNKEYKKPSRSRTAGRKRKRQTRMKEELAECKSPRISGN